MECLSWHRKLFYMYMSHFLPYHFVDGNLKSESGKYFKLLVFLKNCEKKNALTVPEVTLEEKYSVAFDMLELQSSSSSSFFLEN